MKDPLKPAKDAMKAGSYDEAVGLLSDIIAQYSDDSETYMEALVAIGEIHWQRGNYDASTASLERARDLGIRHGRMDLSGWALRLIGNVLFDQGFPDQAEDYYLRSLGLFKEIGEKKGIARCYNNLGVANAERGEYDKALDYYNRALNMYKDLKDQVGEGAVINNLGEIYRFRGEYTDAEYLYQRSLKSDQEIGDLYGQALCWGNLGAVSLGIKDFKEAEKRVTTSLNIFDDLGTRDLVYVDICGLMVSILSQTKRYEEGQEYLDKMWAAEANLRSEFATSICEYYGGVLAQRSGNLHTARKHYIRCLELTEGRVFEYQLLSLIQLVELELQTYRITQEEEYLERMEERLAQTLNLAENTNSYGAQVQLMMLHGLLRMENQQFLKALEELAKARELGFLKGFNTRVDLIDKHIERVNRRIDASINPATESVDQKVKRLQDYIEECQRVVLASK
ncbi:MAG: tetratricopeptide repeat protein [Candidatus Thorarchaeota archaeon]